MMNILSININMQRNWIVFNNNLSFLFSRNSYWIWQLWWQ